MRRALSFLFTVLTQFLKKFECFVAYFPFEVHLQKEPCRLVFLQVFTEGQGDPCSHTTLTCIPSRLPPPLSNLSHTKRNSSSLAWMPCFKPRDDSDLLVRQTMVCFAEACPRILVIQDCSGNNCQVDMGQLQNYISQESFNDFKFLQFSSLGQNKSKDISKCTCD